MGEKKTRRGRRNGRHSFVWLLGLTLLLGIGTSACFPQKLEGNAAQTAQSTAAVTAEQTASEEKAQDVQQTGTAQEQQAANTASAAFDPSSVPAYQAAPYVTVNNGVPFFTDAELSTTAFEQYSDLDAEGRCGTAYANIGRELMPTEERGQIGSVKPTGWHTVKYEFVDGKYLYNRCHLIGYQLTAENANEKNLITGTRYLNIEGMLPFENMVADYVKETGNHVLYRVTPVFEGNNLLASGVLMEGKSVEDGGKGILFCVYTYNVQPGVTIDYATGDSAASGQNAVTETEAAAEPTAETGTQAVAEPAAEPAQAAVQDYVLNTNSHKFHLPDCASAQKISEKNKRLVRETRDQVIAEGYDPCKICNP